MLQDQEIQGAYSFEMVFSGSYDSVMDMYDNYWRCNSGSMVLGFSILWIAIVLHSEREEWIFLIGVRRF